MAVSPTFRTSVDCSKQRVLVAELLIIADSPDSDTGAVGEHRQHIVHYARRRHALGVAAPNISGNSPDMESRDVDQFIAMNHSVNDTIIIIVRFLTRDSFKGTIQYCTKVPFSTVQTYHSVLCKGTIQYCTKVPFSTIQRCHSVLYKCTIQYCTKVPFSTVQRYHSVLYKGAIQYCTKVPFSTIQRYHQYCTNVPFSMAFGNL